MYHLPMDTVTGNVLKGDVDVTLFVYPTLVDGVRGKALSFNGVDQYAEIDAHTYVLNVGIVSAYKFRYCSGTQKRCTWVFI